MGWERESARYVAEAQEILLGHGYPITWGELQVVLQDRQPSRLVGLAVQVISNHEYMGRESERGRVGKALSRHHSMVSAYEEMDILAHVPAAGDGPVIKEHFYRDQRTGLKINQGGDKGREAQSLTEEMKEREREKLIREIDAEYKRRPAGNRGIGAIRKTVGQDNGGISDRTVARKTHGYNPNTT